MNEKISRLMDGELDDAAEIERCHASLRGEDAYATWVCYHVIGDHLRGAMARGERLCRALRAAACRRADGPGAAAPTCGRSGQAATFAWAVAATLAAVTVVGWTAFSMVDAPPTAVAQGP